MPYVTGEVASVIRIMGKLWKAWAKVLEIAKVTFESRDKTLLEFSDMRVMERDTMCSAPAPSVSGHGISPGT